MTKIFIPMGYYEGIWANRSYFLYEINNVISKVNVGMYSDDGLVIFKDMSNSEVERKKKYLINVMDCLLQLKQTWTSLSSLMLILI